MCDLKNIKKYYYEDIKNLIKNIVKTNKNRFLIINTLSNERDIQNHFTKIRLKSNKNTRILVIYYNYIWEPILKIANILGLRNVKQEENWLDQKDIENLLSLADFEVITSQKRMLIPIYVPLVSELVNNYVGHIPLINNLCLTTYVIAKPKTNQHKKFSVSIIIPARNEEGNITKIPSSIPKFGKWQELIFVEGHSSDNTWSRLSELPKKFSKLKIKIYKQRGKGKADAVRLGFKHAKGDILMIYDADRTVEPQDLKKFYNALAENRGDFINGSRLVYPMEKDAMRILNKIGNKLFSFLLTHILGQRFRDTLCGTKAFFKKDYWKFKRFKDDPFGDFELIFGAIENHLKVVEIPVRYKERVYGSTNISRFKHGLQLLKITWLAFKKFRAF